MKKRKIKNLLKKIINETDVQTNYKTIMMDYFEDSIIISPYKSDGLLISEIDMLNMLMEFKYTKELNLLERSGITKILIQILYYLKKFEQNGKDLPTVLFGGNDKHCFCLHINNIIKYLSENVNWNIPASQASTHEDNKYLFEKIFNDKNINPFIHIINSENFDFQSVVDEIKYLNKNKIQKIKITEYNVIDKFNYFVKYVIIQDKNIDSNKQIGIFIKCIFDRINNYLHPNKTNILISNAFKNLKEVRVNSDMYRSFFSRYDAEYSVNEKYKLLLISDKLIEYNIRRNKGEYYTPSIWVNEAHKMIEKTFGLDWKEKYVVWDPAWGTGNLTLGRNFKTAFCSSINETDVELGKCLQSNVNAFVYDFLEHPSTSKDSFYNSKDVNLPDKLFEILNDYEDNSLIFFMNPPFGKAIKQNDYDGTGITDNVIKNEILKNQIKLGQTSSRLQYQFLYKISQFKKPNIHIATFIPVSFLSCQSTKAIRDLIFDKYKIESCFIFNSGEFSGTRDNWSILFLIMSPGKEERNIIPSIIKENINEKIEDIGIKYIYNVPLEESLSYDFKLTNKYKRKNITYPNLSSFINIQNGKNNKFTELSIGSINNEGNSVGGNNIIYLSSAVVSSLGYKFIDPDNFMKAVSLFCARRCASLCDNYLFHDDEFFKPNIDHPEYNQWNNDAIIYSLFNTKSHLTSLRKIKYQNKVWDIKNEWFWMSNKQILELADKYGFNDLYNDAIMFNKDRFVYKKLKDINLSEDAKELLNMSCEMISLGMKNRQKFCEVYPQYHLHAWDAGWKQNKKLFEIYHSDILKSFENKFKEFEKRMFEGIYKFEFLKY